MSVKKERKRKRKRKLSKIVNISNAPTNTLQ